MPEPPVPDAELLGVLGEPGHESESDEFIKCFQALLFAVCFRILRDPHLVEEAIQEAWKRIVRKKDTYNAQHKVEAWLVAIARHTALDQLRKTDVRRRHTGGDFAYAGQTAAAPDDQEDLVRAEVADRLELEITQLPVDQQAVLLLVSNENRTRPGLGYATLKATAEALDYHNSSGEADHNRVNRLLESARATLRRRLS